MALTQLASMKIRASSRLVDLKPIDLPQKKKKVTNEARFSGWMRSAIIVGFPSRLITMQLSTVSNIHVVYADRGTSKISKFCVSSYR